MGTAVETGQPVGGVSKYREHVNPQWVRLLELLEMNVRYQRCVGAELFTAEGRRIVDFLSGYCVHNVGHNHPDVVLVARFRAHLDLQRKPHDSARRLRDGETSSRSGAAHGR